jgi:hypothetical protein
MKKLKAKKETLKGTKAAYLAYKTLAQEFMFKLQHPPSRLLFRTEAADAQGKLNGMTTVELIAITNLLSTQGEKLYLVPQGKAITGYAVKDAPVAPLELL